jgi:hypothetical protein
MRFEEQDCERGQAQYARARYHQALVYEAEGKKMPRERTMMYARQALETLCDEGDTARPDPNRGLGREDFEAQIELGFI